MTVSVIDVTVAREALDGQGGLEGVCHRRHRGARSAGWAGDMTVSVIDVTVAGKALGAEG
jgi:hypothetical protein